jgi:hypothetical protein
LCPRSDESAGKRRSTRVRKSGTWIKTTLITAAWAAVRVKTSYLRAQFLRIKTRRGAKKAILAVAASMLTAVFHMLCDGTEYNDLGSERFDRQDRSKTIRGLLKRLQDLGCDVRVWSLTVSRRWSTTDVTGTSVVRPTRLPRPLLLSIDDLLTRRMGDSLNDAPRLCRRFLRVFPRAQTTPGSVSFVRRACPPRGLVRAFAQLRLNPKGWPWRRSKPTISSSAPAPLAWRSSIRC